MKKQKAKPVILKTDKTFEEAIRGLFDPALLKKRKPKTKTTKQEKKE